METAYYILNNYLSAIHWILLLGVFMVSLTVNMLIAKKKQMRSTQAILVALSITYIFFILLITLITRTPAVSADGTLLHKAKWIPLWSWYEVLVNHDRELFEEIMLNVVLFVPVGALLVLQYKIWPSTAFLIGYIFSDLIEITQFITGRGLFEWDDMLHNAIGCMAGCLITQYICERIKEHGGRSR